MPLMSTLPRRSAFCAWITVTSGLEGRHCGEPFTREGTDDELDPRIRLNEVGAEIAAEDRARHARSASRVGEGHGGVAVLLDLQGVGPAMLDGIAETMQ